MRIIILLLLLFVSLSFPVSIITKYGTFYSGKTIEETDEYIVLLGDSGIFEINKEDIKEKIITFNYDSPVLKRDYTNRKGLRFLFSSGIGEHIFVNNTHVYPDATTEDVYINQITELGIYYYMDLPEKYSIEVGGGFLNRKVNIDELSANNSFNCNFVSLTFRRMVFRSLNGGYFVTLGLGSNLYSSVSMKAYSDNSKQYTIKYNDTLGYHLLAEAWSNMPKIWIFNDISFVMGIRWNFGSNFEIDKIHENGNVVSVAPYNNWNNIGLNGFMFNASLAFLW